MLVIKEALPNRYQKTRLYPVIPTPYGGAKKLNNDTKNNKMETQIRRCLFSAANSKVAIVRSLTFSPLVTH